METENASLGDCVLLTQCLKHVPYEIVDSALCATDRTKRQLGKFPDHLVVYYVIFMTLFMEASYLHVYEKLRDTFAWLSEFGTGIQGLTDSAIVQARQRIGPEPLKELFKLVVRPLATERTPGALFNGLRIVVLDGSTFDVPDTTANAQFGRAINKSGAGAFPMVRVVALMEMATRAVIDLEIGPFKGSSEVSLAKSIIGRMQPGLLCLADRNFPGSELCNSVVAQSSHFLWRVKSHLKLKPLEVLEDGSYLARLSQTAAESIIVRVIEYALDGGTETYRLVSSLLDAKQVPAELLAKLYPHRWSEETFYGEIKNVLRAPRIILRSHNPATVFQELYALFLAHFVVRSFMFEAAQTAAIPPDELSFKHSVHVLRTNMPNLGSFPP
jgi:hypothetical protein